MLIHRPRSARLSEPAVGADRVRISNTLQIDRQASPLYILPPRSIGSSTTLASEIKRFLHGTLRDLLPLSQCFSHPASTRMTSELANSMDIEARAKSRHELRGAPSSTLADPQQCLHGCAFMAGGLVVLIYALMSTLSAQTTEPSENLPPRVLRTAEMIGVRSQVEELVQLRSAPKRDDIRELQLVQHLQGVVMASALDVESVNARIDYETAHLQEVQVYLSARRDRRVDLLNLGNLFIGGGVGAVGSGLQLISSAAHAGNVVSTSAGFGGTVLSVIGLQQQKGQLRSPEYTPAMLAKLLGNSPPDSSDYPQEVWVYLTTPDPTLPHGSTGQEHLVSEWTRFGHLKEKPDPKTMTALTTTGRDGTKLSIEMIGERTAMLADVRAHVNTMLVDLAELMMFVAQQK